MRLFGLDIDQLVSSVCQKTQAPKIPAEETQQIVAIDTVANGTSASPNNIEHEQKKDGTILQESIESDVQHEQLLSTSANQTNEVQEEAPPSPHRLQNIEALNQWLAEIEAEVYENAMTPLSDENGLFHDQTPKQGSSSSASNDLRQRRQKLVDARERCLERFRLFARLQRHVDNGSLKDSQQLVAQTLCGRFRAVLECLNSQNLPDIHDIPIAVVDAERQTPSACSSPLGLSPSYAAFSSSSSTSSSASSSASTSSLTQQATNGSIVAADIAEEEEEEAALDDDLESVQSEVLVSDVLRRSIRGSSTGLRRSSEPPSAWSSSSKKEKLVIDQLLRELEQCEQVCQININAIIVGNSNK